MTKERTCSTWFKMPSSFLCWTYCLVGDVLENLYKTLTKCVNCSYNICVLYILTSKCASRNNGVQFFICYLARWLRTRRFSEPTFDPPEPQIIGKTQCFATFLPFPASASSFFWLFLFSDLLSSSLLFSLTLPISAFHLSILPEVWLLNFLRLYIIYIYIYIYHIMLQ